ncbi:MAG: ATP-binding protein, partial [Methanosphaera sp.]|nr:ATP-binding protein [Methanosphaera sp.]
TFLEGLLQYNENESKQNYLKSTYDSIVLHDILERSNIRDFDLLERLLDFLISNTGQMYSANSISKYLKEDNKYIKRESSDISVKTLINYNDNIQKSMIISKCKREDIIRKKKLKFLEKYYVVDLGFYTLLNENKRNYGQILETIVYNELRRRGYAVTVGEVNNLEVDFIARKFKKKIYVQVSTSLQDDKTREREFKPLKKIKDNFPKYIISNDTFDFSEDGIIHLNIKEFLKKETF